MKARQACTLLGTNSSLNNNNNRVNRRLPVIIPCFLAARLMSDSTIHPHTPPSLSRMRNFRKTHVVVSGIECSKKVNSDKRGLVKTRMSEAVIRRIIYEELQALLKLAPSKEAPTATTETRTTKTVPICDNNVSSASDEDDPPQCDALTRKGLRCCNDAIYRDGLCDLHHHMRLDKKPLGPKKLNPLCKGLTKTGQPCSNHAMSDSRFCYQHVSAPSSTSTARRR